MIDNILYSFSIPSKIPIGNYSGIIRIDAYYPYSYSVIWAYSDDGKKLAQIADELAITLPEIMTNREMKWTGKSDGNVLYIKILKE